MRIRYISDRRTGFGRRRVPWKTPNLKLYSADVLEGLMNRVAQACVQDSLEPKNPALSPRAKVRDLIHRMLAESRDEFVVWSDGPRGIVTHQDVLRSFAAGANAKATRISEIVHEDAWYAVEGNCPALPLMVWMIRRRVPLVLVLQEGQLSGIFSPVRALTRLTEESFRGRVDG